MVRKQANRRWTVLKGKGYCAERSSPEISAGANLLIHDLDAKSSANVCTHSQPKQSAKRIENALCVSGVWLDLLTFSAHAKEAETEGLSRKIQKEVKWQVGYKVFCEWQVSLHLTRQCNPRLVISSSRKRRLMVDGNYWWYCGMLLKWHYGHSPPFYSLLFTLNLSKS